MTTGAFLSGGGAGRGLRRRFPISQCGPVRRTPVWWSPSSVAFDGCVSLGLAISQLVVY